MDSAVLESEAVHDFAPLRSVLFVPANDGRRWIRALDSGADALILDLEDAIAPNEKERARVSVPLSLSARTQYMPIVLLRVNGLDTPWGEPDLEMAIRAHCDGILVPKAEGSSLSALPTEDRPVIAIIETAVGLRSVHEVAAHPRVRVLLLGDADRYADMGLKYRPDGQELLFARSLLVMASATADLRPPFDVVDLDIHDNQELRAESVLGRSQGMGAKACIHPGQIPIVNEVITPSLAEVASARDVVEVYPAAIAGGSGVAVLNGKMIDLHLVLEVERTLSKIETKPSTYVYDDKSRFIQGG